MHILALRTLELLNVELKGLQSKNFFFDYKSCEVNLRHHMYVLIKDIDYVIRIKCLSSESVGHLKSDVSEILGSGVGVDDISLIFGGKVMEDNQPLIAYNVNDGAVINLGFRLKGGDGGIFGTDSSNFSTIWYFVLVVLFILAPFFISGVLPIIGHIYGVAVANIVKRLGTKILMMFDAVGEEVEEEERKELESVGNTEGVEMSLRGDGREGMRSEEGVVGEEGVGSKGTEGDQVGGNIFGNRFKRGMKKVGNAGKKVGKTMTNKYKKVRDSRKGLTKVKRTNENEGEVKEHEGTKVGAPMGTMGAVTSAMSGLSSSSRDFIKNFMANRVDGILADDELVCDLYNMDMATMTPQSLRSDPTASRYYSRVFMLAGQYAGQNLPEGVTQPDSLDVENDTVAFFKYLRDQIDSRGLALNRCLKGHKTFRKILRFLAWIFKVFGLWIFVYILTYVIISPLVFAYTTKTGVGFPTRSCTAVHLTKWITLTLVLVFMGVFVFTALPTMTVEAIEGAADEMSAVPKDVVKVTVLPVANMIAKMTSFFQYGFFNLLTFGYFGIYQRAVNVGIQYLYMTLAEADTFSCKDPDQLESLSNKLSEMLNNPVSQIELNNYKVTETVNIIIDALSERRMAEIKEQSMIKYIMAKIVRFLFCRGLNMADWLYKMFKDMGSPDVITDLIIDGNASGIAYSIAFIVILCFVMFSSSMFGITFS